MSSGLRQQITVTLDDGRVLKTETSLMDTLRWEKVNNRGWFDREKTSLSQISFIAWSSLARAGEYDGNWEAFSAHIADLELVDDAAGGEAGEPPDPTGPDPGAEPSSSWP